MIILEGSAGAARCPAPLRDTIEHNILFHTERTVGMIDERAVSKGGKESAESKKEETLQGELSL